MIDDLLPFYERELAVLRRRSAQFAEQNPKIAGRLSLGRDDSQDPHVERLLQGVAFLNAHLTKRLDDDFPELAEALLDLLYPHYLRPVPSMTIVEMAIDPKQAALIDGHRVPRGSLLESERIDGDVCTYRTCFDVSLWPVKITAAKLSGPPFRLPILPPASTQSALEIQIEPLSKALHPLCSRGSGSSRPALIPRMPPYRPIRGRSPATGSSRNFLPCRRSSCSSIWRGFRRTSLAD